MLEQAEKWVHGLKFKLLEFGGNTLMWQIKVAVFQKLYMCWATYLQRRNKLRHHLG